MEDAAQLRRIFTIATRCGMLIWRRFSPNIDLCIAEPYHHDRVANQFGLDQVIPYTPLISLYTTQDIGVAYAYWEHLLRPGQVGPDSIPETRRFLRSSLDWAEWWKTFFDPFASIGKDLRNGNARGRIPYEDRKQKYATEGLSGRVPARKICHSDYTVIKEVVVQNWDRRLAGLSAKFKACQAVWMQVLYAYLNPDTPIVPSAQVLRFICMVSPMYTLAYMFIHTATMNFVSSLLTVLFPPFLFKGSTPDG
jgi:hypothetical protein